MLLKTVTLLCDPSGLLIQGAGCSPNEKCLTAVLQQKKKQPLFNLKNYNNNVFSLTQAVIFHLLKFNCKLRSSMLTRPCQVHFQEFFSLFHCPVVSGLIILLLSGVDW